jgi:Holliday junction resolvasome RuvABC endonuclease subunit
MGIDPSYKSTGWSVMKIEDRWPTRVLAHGVADGVLKESDRMLTQYPHKDLGDDLRYTLYKQMAKQIVKIGKKHNVEHYIVESMYTNILARSMMYSIEARAIICAEIVNTGSCLSIHSAQSVKKFMLGTVKKTTKKQMISAVHELYVVDKISDHEADAIALVASWYDYINK